MWAGPRGPRPCAGLPTIAHRCEICTPTLPLRSQGPLRSVPSSHALTPVRPVAIRQCCVPISDARRPYSFRSGHVHVPLARQLTYQSPATRVPLTPRSCAARTPRGRCMSPPSQQSGWERCHAVRFRGCCQSSSPVPSSDHLSMVLHQGQGNGETRAKRISGTMPPWGLAQDYTKTMSKQASHLFSDTETGRKFEQGWST